MVDILKIRTNPQPLLDRNLQRGRLLAQVAQPTDRGGSITGAGALPQELDRAMEQGQVGLLRGSVGV